MHLTRVSCILPGTQSRDKRRGVLPIPLAFVVGATTDSTKAGGIPVHSSWTATVERGGHPSHPEYRGAQPVTTLLRQRKRKCDETTSTRIAATAPASKRHDSDEDHEVRSLTGCSVCAHCCPVCLLPSLFVACCLLSVVMWKPMSVNFTIIMPVCATAGS